MCRARRGQQALCVSAGISDPVLTATWVMQRQTWPYCSAPPTAPCAPASCSLSKYLSSVTCGYAGSAQKSQEYNSRSYLGPISSNRPTSQTHKIARVSLGTPFMRHRMLQKDCYLGRILCVFSLITSFILQCYFKKAQCYTGQRESSLLFFFPPMLTTGVCAGCQKVLAYCSALCCLYCSVNIHVSCGFHKWFWST